MTRQLRTSHALIIIAVLIVIAFGDILFLGRGLYLTDLTSYHYPMKWIVRETISAGDFPYWNRFYSGGQPMAANPAYEVFYPPQWLVFLPSYHFGFQLHIILHVFIGAAGMFFLARSLGVSHFAALFAAVSFVFCGPYLSLSSRLPLFFSLSWMPLALYFATKSGGKPPHSKAGFAAAAACVAMQMIIGEPTIALQTWLLILCGAGFSRRLHSPAKAGATLAIFVVAALLAAVQLIPGFDHARDSVRAQAFPFQVVSNWSLPVDRPLEFVWPSIFRNLLTANGQPVITTMYPFRTDAFIAEVYLGILVMILAIAGVFAGVRGRWIALSLTTGALLVAWGDHTPLLRLLYDVGVFRNIRYPEKFVITASVVLVLWAAVVLDRLLAGDRKAGATAAVIAALLTAAAILVALAQTRWYFAGNVARAAAAMFLIAMLRRKPDSAWRWVLLSAVAIDLGIATHHVVPRMPRQYFDAPPIARMIPASGRVYHEAAWEVWDATGTAFAYFGNRPLHDFFWIFRNGAFPNLPARWNRELGLEDDIDQTALKTSGMFLEALKVARRGGPGAEEGILKLSNVTSRLRFRPAQGLSGESSTWMPVDVEAGNPYPRYWFVDRLEPVAGSATGFAAQARRFAAENVAFVPFAPFTPAKGTVLDVKETRNGATLRVRAQGRAFLAASVTNHKWWSATIDGRPLDIATTNLTYQGLVVPPGGHTIVLTYRNPLIRTGALMSALALLALVTITLFDIYRAQEYRRSTQP